MRSFFANKLNIILTIVLATLLGTLGFFGYKLIFDNKKVYVPDFSDKSEADINKWCTSFENNPCKITSDYSETIEKGKLIYQSIKADEVLGDNISFIISLGKKIDIKFPSITKDTTKDDIDKWIKDNDLRNVLFIEEFSDSINKGNIIRIDHEDIVDKNSEIRVFISKGKNVKPDETIYVDYGTYLNLSVSQFEAKVKEIGLKAKHVSSRDDYSSTIEENRIVWHGSGTYVENEEISYGLSLGIDKSAIKVEAGTWVGKSFEEFKKAVSQLGSKGLKPNHRDSWDDYSDTIEKGYIVRHGSGSYVEEENISYGLSLGKKDESSDIEIDAGKYVGKTFEEFKDIVSKLGLQPKYKDSWDDYSDTIAKGNIIKHGSGTYTKDENISYGLSLGKKDGSSEIVISKGTYIGKTLEEFTTIVTSLGLKPKHKTSYDDYSDTIAKGSLDWHGSGTYLAGDEISYSLSLGKKDGESGDVSTCYVAKNDYVGKNESEMLEAIKKLTTNGLTPNHGHVNHNDEYSDVYAKGVVIWHGSGEYKDKEQFNYTLSLGKRPDVGVDVISYAGKSESEFLSYLSGLNLLKGNRSEEYSDSVSEGKLISNSTGKFNEGDKVNYVVSLGMKMAYIMRPDKYVSMAGSSFDATCENMKAVLNDFSKVVYTPVSVPDYTVGQITKITVEINGEMKDDYSAGNYPINTNIIVYICNETTH